MIQKLSYSFLVLVWLVSCKVASTTSSQAQTTSASQDDLSKYTFTSPSEPLTSEVQKTSKDTAQKVNYSLQVNQVVNANLDSITNFNKRYTSAPGYRILIYTGNRSEESAMAKKTVYDWSTQYGVYTQYKQPSFRVKVGDFVDRVQAYYVLSDIIKIFPGAVIVPDQIAIK